VGSTQSLLQAGRKFVRSIAYPTFRPEFLSFVPDALLGPQRALYLYSTTWHPAMRAVAPILCAALDGCRCFDPNHSPRKVAEAQEPR
jgi:hypothetical protein